MKRFLIHNQASVSAMSIHIISAKKASRILILTTSLESSALLLRYRRRHIFETIFANHSVIQVTEVDLWCYPNSCHWHKTWWAQEWLPQQKWFPSPWMFCLLLVSLVYWFYCWMKGWIDQMSHLMNLGWSTFVVTNSVFTLIDLGTLEDRSMVISLQLTIID